MDRNAATTQETLRQRTFEAPHPADGLRILTTLHWPRRAAWTSRVDLLDRTRLSPGAILARIGAAPGRYDAVVLDGATGGAVRLSDLGGAALLARRRSGPAVVVTDATWGAGNTWWDRLASRAGLAAIDSPRVTYCVLSSDEARLFPTTWGVPPSRVVCTPFYYTATDEDLAVPSSEGGHVFSGGDSVRNYGPLVEVARQIDAPVILATSAVSAEQRRALPPNVRAGWLRREEYVERMRTASVVVVALRQTRDRSAGQQSYLNAMAMGKLVVVPDVLGVREYVDDGRTGIVVPPGDAAALLRAVRWGLDPAHRAEARAIAERAREMASARFRPDCYVDHVLRAVSRAVLGASSQAAPNLEEVV